MGPSSDKLEQEIGTIRGSLEAHILELRQLSQQRIKRAARTALIVLGVGAAVGVAAVGVYAVWRTTRPVTTRERMRRLIPPGLLRDATRLRQSAELRARRGVPSVRLYVGKQQPGEKPAGGGWEKVAAQAGKAAGTAAAGVAVNRLLRAVAQRNKAAG